LFFVFKIKHILLVKKKQQQQQNTLGAGEVDQVRSRVQTPLPPKNKTKQKTRTTITKKRMEKNTLKIYRNEF
jgi:hypothetical protein